MYMCSKTKQCNISTQHSIQFNYLTVKISIHSVFNVSSREAE